MTLLIFFSDKDPGKHFFCFREREVNVKGNGTVLLAEKKRFYNGAKTAVTIYVGSRVIVENADCLPRIGFVREVRPNGAVRIHFTAYVGEAPSMLKGGFINKEMPLSECVCEWHSASELRAIFAGGEQVNAEREVDATCSCNAETVEWNVKSL